MYLNLLSGLFDLINSWNEALVWGRKRHAVWGHPKQRHDNNTSSTNFIKKNNIFACERHFIDPSASDENYNRLFFSLATISIKWIETKRNTKVTCYLLVCTSSNLSKKKHQKFFAEVFCCPTLAQNTRTKPCLARHPVMQRSHRTHYWTSKVMHQTKQDDWKSTHHQEAQHHPWLRNDTNCRRQLLWLIVNDKGSWEELWSSWNHWAEKYVEMYIVSLRGIDTRHGRQWLYANTWKCRGADWFHIWVIKCFKLWLMLVG